MIYFIFLIYLTTRIWPYIGSQIPLGYDPGLYLYLWKNNLSIYWLKNLYPPLIYYLGKFLSWFTQPENIVIPLIIVAAILLFWSVYLYGQNKWTVFLLTISVIQYRFWWWYYLKNILALSFVFFYLYLDKKKSRWRYIFPLAIPLLHQPTAIIFFVILVIKKKWKEIILFLISFAGYYLPNYHTSIDPFLKNIFSHDEGTFYSLKEASKLMVPYLPLSIYEIYLDLKEKKNRFEGIMFGICLGIVISGYYLARRYIPFWDIFTIILAGRAAERIFIKHQKIGIIYGAILLLSIAIFTRNYSAPMIGRDEFEEIKLLSGIPEKAFILVSDNFYTSWIYGYSDRKAIAPGFGEYDKYWGENDWQDFWLSGDKEKEMSLLNKLPKPLYIWKGDQNRLTKFSLEGDCFQRYSWHCYEYICP